MTNKKLIILRGPPGSGKSQTAKRLVGKGLIHSTDAYFMVNGKYAFNIDNVGKFHDFNLMSSIESMKNGTSPVIIDNTNIIASDCIKYVEEGKIYGYEIIVIEPDVPWAFDIDELVKRNEHRVPRESIIEMLLQYEDHETFKRKLGL